METLLAARMRSARANQVEATGGNSRAPRDLSTIELADELYAIYPGHLVFRPGSSTRADVIAGTGSRLSSLVEKAGRPTKELRRLGYCCYLRPVRR